MSDQPSDVEIFAAALELRSALEAIDPSYWSNIYIEAFPRGACGHCAELLAFHFYGRFDITADYVSMNLGDGEGNWDQGHAWLEWNGLLVDISGDQFGWEPVLVTRNPPWAYLNAQLNDRRRWIFDASWWGQQCAEIWAAAKPFLQRD